MRHFKPEQLALLVNSVPEHYVMIMLVGFWHGLRVSEIMELRSRDIQHGYVKVKRKKGSLPTLQPYVLHVDADKKETALSEYSRLKEMAKLPLDTRLFPMTRFAVNKMMMRLNKRLLDLPKCHPHMLKHTCAHVMLDGGKKLPEVQKRLGHKKAESTMMYLLVTEEQAAEGMGDLI
jgi:type 1 fimbriae regulatory protein FimB